MQNINLIRYREHEKLFPAAATVFFDALTRFDKSFITVGLPGGRSIIPLFEDILNQSDYISAELWRRIQFFMVDERLVPLNSEESNFRVVQPYLSILKENDLITSEQIHPFVFDKQLISQSLIEYQQLLNKYGGSFDIIILGVGEDAHIAGLFPNHSALHETQVGFITFADSPKPPPHRMTSTLPLIRQAKVAIALFIGEGKRGALSSYQNKNLTLDTCPVKVIDDVSYSYVITDLV